MKKKKYPAFLILSGLLAGFPLFLQGGATGFGLKDAAMGNRAESGTISGTLKSVWLRRYAMVVYLESAAGEFPPPENTPTIDQKNKMFVPHVLPVLEGTTVEYVNHDDTKHNVYYLEPDGEKVNLGTGDADWAKDVQVNQPGVYLHRCNIHDEMSAYLVVLENPFFNLVKRQASSTPVSFKFEGVPPGEYNLRVWCEKFYDRPDLPFNRAWKVSVKPGAETVIEVKP